MNSHFKQNKVRTMLSMIAASVAPMPLFNRVNRVRIEAKKMLGLIPEGTGRYRTVCPIGAGQGPTSHKFTNQVGCRKFARRQKRFIKEHSIWAGQNGLA